MLSPEQYVQVAAMCLLVASIAAILVQRAKHGRTLARLESEKQNESERLEKSKEIERGTEEARGQIESRDPPVKEVLHVLNGDTGLGTISRSLQGVSGVVDKSDAALSRLSEFLKSSMSTLQLEREEISSSLTRSDEVAARLERAAGELTKAAAIYAAEMQGVTFLICSMSRSWLHTPYPKTLRLAIPNGGGVLRWVADKFGIKLAASFRVHLLCDREHEMKNHYDYTKVAYELPFFELKMDRAALAFYLRTGLMIPVVYAVGHAGVAHAVLLHHTSPPVQHVAKELEDQILRYTSETARDFIAHLSAERATEKLFHFWNKHLKDADIVVYATKLDTGMADLQTELREGELTILEGGSSLHLHIGALVQEEDSRRSEDHPPLGGLARVLVTDAHKAHYEWLCDDCRRAAVAKYIS